MGRPAGQMVIEEFFDLDSTYQTVTYRTTPAGPVIQLHYPDQPNVDVFNRNIYLLLDPTTNLPSQVRIVQQRGGRWTTTKTLSHLRVDDPADAAFFASNSFLTTYTPVKPAAPVAAPTLVGRLAPDFQLPSLAKVPMRLRSYRGKVVLLDFWETSCSPCIAAMPKLQLLQRRYQAKGLVVVGVLLDAKSTERAAGILQR
ncbi:MAG: TlpA family protein disulfide reductase [Janthinobacterium lividum]